MKLQITVQEGKFKVDVSISVEAILLILALLV